MDSTIPRETDPIAQSSGSPTSTPITFCLWWGARSPPQVVGRTAEDAEQRLVDSLARYYREDAEPPADDPPARAQAELDRARAWGLTVHCAPDETAAFEVWCQVSMLTAAEAFRRWRAAFPCAIEDDPLVAVVHEMVTTAMPNRRQRTPTPVTPAMARRYSLLGRFADRLRRAPSRSRRAPSS